MSIAANTVLRAVAELLLPGTNIAQNVWYFRFLDDGGSNADQDVVDDIVDQLDSMYNSLRNEVSDTVILGEVKVYQWDVVGADWDEVGSGVLATVMLDTGHMLPHGVAPVVTARTTDPDVNGRKFFAGYGENSCNASTLNGTALTALLVIGAQWVLGFTGTATGSAFDAGVWSVKLLAFKKFVDNFIINAIVGYQRRRKPGVGI